MSNTDKSRKKSYQNDPRYKAFYQKVKKDNETSSSYDEDVQPMSLDELEETNWDGQVRPGMSAPHPPHRAKAQSTAIPVEQPSATPQPPSAKVISTPAPGPEGLTAGVIMSFDDGSVAIFKDAVSGKDYALFYFLEPDGSLVPRGIFLEQYEKQRIGQIGTTLFDDMIMKGKWDRDGIIFHLDGYQYTAQIRALEARTPAPGLGRDATPLPPSRGAAPAADQAPLPPPARQRKKPAPAVQPPPAPAPIPRDPLERGRQVRINVGGKVWESIYWTTDEIGPIVAHCTNRDWALMHLDLKRFKDAIEFGDILPYDQLQEIERSLASQRAN